MAGSDSIKILTTPDQWEHQQRVGSAFGVYPVIHHMDYMYKFMAVNANSTQAAVENYFAAGDAWSKRLLEIVTGSLPSGVGSGSILEFASGYGRVTRFLPKLFPLARLVACDIHPGACRFIRSALGVSALQSDADPASALLEGPYEVVSAMSFFSHMPDDTFGPWLAALWNVVSPNGLLMFSTHGAAMAPGGRDTDVYRTIVQSGYSFTPSSEQHDLDPTEYGSSFVTPDYVLSKITSHAPRAELLAVEEGGWFRQDLYVIRKGTESGSEVVG